MRWYVLNVYSGFEKKVVESVRERAKNKGLESFFGQMLVPSEDVIEVKRGMKVSTERCFYPGYILVEMEMNDENWHLVKTVPKVGGFLGSKVKPTPITSTEVDRILDHVAESVSNPRNTIVFEIGEKIRVCEGPFNTFNGIVEEVDQEKERMKVSVSIFGRPTNVDLGFYQVEKT
ncbi:MAG: transcription termination/antitermination protein NusG [Holosporales bacterium]|jgi:transcriptional antiterminator NusG|nr:transcription termination/antitermination protein NusG [Holosporales bacterium]